MTEAQYINKLASHASKHGLIETSKVVNVTLTFVGNETPQGILVLSAWKYVLHSS